MPRLPLLRPLTPLRDRRGATVVEYGLILATIALGVVGAMSATGHSLADIVKAIGTNLMSAR